MEVALQGIGTHRIAFWPLYGWNATFCYTILSEQGAQGWIFEQGKHAPGQSDLDRTSVLLGENPSFLCLKVELSIMGAWR